MRTSAGLATGVGASAVAIALFIWDLLPAQGLAKPDLVLL